MTEVGKLRPSLNPWQRILWTPQQEQAMYRFWGTYFIKKQQLDRAVHYYNRALDLHVNDPDTLYSRSVCKRQIAKIKEALDDALAAREIFQRDAYKAETADVNVEICDALYELNRFEDCKVELHENARKFSGKKVATFQNRITVVDENLKDSLGDTLGPFIMKNGKHFEQVSKDMERKKHIEKRPMWKVLKEQGECDVQSIIDKEEILLSPLEVAQRERSFKNFYQHYLNRAWKDVVFLRNLRDNPNFLLPQTKVSTPILKDLVNSKYDIITKFAKMLHARSPLYNEQALKTVDKKVTDKHHEDFLNRAQWQTRRNMMTTLETIKKYRESHEIEKMSKYIESVMGDYVVIKTSRVMPWKFEFINEVYNLLALSHCDRYRAPDNIRQQLDENRMPLLLRIKMDKYIDKPIKFVFGDRSTYVEPDAIDPKKIAYKNFLLRLEKRLIFAKFSIEKSYLYHEIARAHLKQSRFNDCCSAARKGIKEAKWCKNHPWQFINMLLICKSHTIQNKVERCQEALEEAKTISENLKSTTIFDFINMCITINNEIILAKKKTRSMESMFTKGSRSRSVIPTDMLSEKSSESSITSAEDTKRETGKEKRSSLTNKVI